MRHASIRLKGDIVSRLNEFVMRYANGIPLYYFLGQGLRYGRCSFGSHQKGGRGSVVKLRVERLNILEMAGRRGE